MGPESASEKQMGSRREMEMKEIVSDADRQRRWQENCAWHLISLICIPRNSSSAFCFSPAHEKKSTCYGLIDQLHTCLESLNPVKHKGGGVFAQCCFTPQKQASDLAIHLAETSLITRARPRSSNSIHFDPCVFVQYVPPLSRLRLGPFLLLRQPLTAAGAVRKRFI